MTPRAEPGEAREINDRLGVAGADEDSTFAGAQRMDVAGSDQLLGLGVGRDRGPNRLGALAGRDPGRDSVARVDRDGEAGAAAGRVELGLRMEIQLIADLGGEGRGRSRRRRGAP